MKTGLRFLNTCCSFKASNLRKGDIRHLLIKCALSGSHRADHMACIIICLWVCMWTYIQSRCGEENMCWLGDICSMETVVVRYVSMVMVLQGHDIRDKSVDWDTKRLQQLTLLRREENRLSFRNERTSRTQDQHVQMRGVLHVQPGFTWKMAYIMQLRGLLLEYSATLNTLKLHLSRSSSS